jgi:hypothetical protein
MLAGSVVIRGFPNSYEGCASLVFTKGVFRTQSWSVNVGASTRSGLYTWSGDQTAMGAVMLRETCFDYSSELLFTKHF